MFAAPAGPQAGVRQSEQLHRAGQPDPPQLIRSGWGNGTGASTVDTISGFRDWNDVNGDNVVEQSEFTVVNGSLLQKSIFAQVLFDAKFLLPAAPASPDFFLIPGNNQVTALWQPSSTETGAGDPFFQVAGAVRCVTGPRTRSMIRYKQNDVEGYRVYRAPGGQSRRDDPRWPSARLAAGTSLPDYTGTINTDLNCASLSSGSLPHAPAWLCNNKDGTDIGASVTPVDAPGQPSHPGSSRPGSGCSWPTGRRRLITADTAVTGGPRRSVRAQERLPTAGVTPAYLRLRRRDAAEQLPVLLLGYRVRRKLLPVG